MAYIEWLAECEEAEKSVDDKNIEPLAATINPFACISMALGVTS